MTLYWTRRTEWTAVALLILLAFGLRFWQLAHVPPGWRDDELINSLVISQKVLDGDWQLYYPDASGHEALYHALNAIFLGVFGPSVPGIRWLSMLLGTTAVPLTYAVGKRLFGALTGVIAAAALAFSFWSLVYSRIGLRHITLTVLSLAAFYFFLKALGMVQGRLSGARAPVVHFTLTAVFTGLAFYTYFAARGLPLILLAYCGYLLLFARPLLKRNLRGLALMFGLMVLFALPLAIVLGRQPEAEGRVGELAVPLVEARAGNFEPLRDHVVITLSMFHATGDGEWLYNIPDRPIFSLFGAAVFWIGVVLAAWLTLRPLISRFTARVSRDPDAPLAAAFLLLWWLAGIAPAFVSVPPASLGHTILAQPAVFILAALPAGWLAGRQIPSARWLAPLLGLALVLSVALRDLPDYFVEWPQRGMVRFLYRADIQDVADYVNATPALTDFGVTGLLAGPWDRLALEIGLDDATAVRPRWYNPERALLLEPAVSFSGYPEVASPYEGAFERVPGVPGIGGYRLNQVDRQLVAAEPVCFANGLCWLTADYDPATGMLELGWEVREPLQLPDMPLISNPPPPGVYAGPRLHVFAQLQDTDGNFLVGEDGLWVDPATLQVGDVFVQRHRLPLPDQNLAGVTAVFGLYDPMTGERIPATDGVDSVRVTLE